MTLLNIQNNGIIEMNARIQDLIEDSKDYNDIDVDLYGSALYGSPPVVNPEELVRLVVMECAKVCRENNAFVAAHLIKKHFGFE